MSDAACHQNSNNIQVVTTASSCSLTTIEEHWRKGIILVQIWREVLRVILFSGGPGKRLDEKSKREMWILLVAAGSGYLARCWHRTLKPKPQLTDQLHGSPDPRNREVERRPVVDTDNNNNLLTSSSSPSPPSLLGDKTETPLDAPRVRKTPELAPKPLKRNFSPKAFGKKLFSSDTSKSGRSLRRELGSSSAAVAAGHRSSVSFDGGDRESNKSIAPGEEKELSHDAAASVGERSSSGRRNPWSSFRSHSSGKAQAREGSPGAVEDGDSSGESSPGCLKRAGDSFRKSRERRKSDNGSLSSRSLQGILGDGGPPSAGSSRREMDPADSLDSSSELTNRSLSSLGAFAATEISESSGEVSESPEVTSRRKTTPEVDEKSSSPDIVRQESSSSSTIQKEALSSTSVAAVVARIEKGNTSAKAETVNAILSLRAANQAQAEAQAQGQSIVATDIGKVRTLRLDVLEQNSVADEEIPPGGKGKRRAGDGGETGGANGEEGKLGGLAAPLSSGKRTKDSKDSTRSDSSGLTVTSITGKWMKDASFVPQAVVRDLNEASSSPGLGAVDLSQVFFGFDSTFLGSPAEEKSPFRFYRKSSQLGRFGRSNMRKMRESPRLLSALESCANAQLLDRDNEGSRVARSLNFSSTSHTQSRQLRGGEGLDKGVEIPFLKNVSRPLSPTLSSEGRGGLSGGSEQPNEGALGLPLLVSPPPSNRLASRGAFSSERGRREVLDSASKHPRKVVLEDRGRVVSSQSSISDVLWRSTTLPVALKKRKVSQACSPSSNNSTLVQAKAYELEALVIPPMEGLLFSFGVGIGVMSLIDGPDDKFESLNRELQKSQEMIENLNKLLFQAKESSVVHTTATLSKEIVVASCFSSEETVTVEQVSVNESPLDLPSVTPALESPLDPLSVTPAIEEAERPFDLYRREAPETPQQTEHMAELEAELEAELDALTSSITDVVSGPPDFQELDPEGVAGVADRDLGIEGLPAAVDWDDDNDDFITEEPVHNGGGVPPRELSRLLRKVQNSRQEYRITELEVDLQEAVEKLQNMEKELQLLREKIAPPSAGTAVESPDLVGGVVSEGLFQIDNSSWSAKIEQLNQSVFEDQESRRDETIDSDVEATVRNMGDTQEPGDEQSAASTSGREESESNILVSVASEPASSLRESLDSNLASELLPRAVSDPVSRLGGPVAIEVDVLEGIEDISGGQEMASGTPPISEGAAVSASRTGLGARRSVSSMFSSQESMTTMLTEAQADNDAVCDEFLSSVFCSPDGSQLGLSSAMSSPLADQIPLANTPEESSEASVVSKDAPLDTAGTAQVEDLDQVVGQLLKRDSNSVKNAINAFLRWEAAEKDDAPSRDDLAEDEAIMGGYSRRTAGKNPTPQKTPLLSSVTSSGTPQKTSMISARLEQLARSAFTSDKMPYLEKPAGNARRLGATTGEKSPGVGRGKFLDVFQQQQSYQPKLDDKSSKALGLWEYPVTRKEPHSPQTFRRGGGEAAGKAEAAMAESTLRDLFRGESPVFGGSERDFQTLLDSRRELRYSSSKVQLSLAGSDTVPVFRQRDDPSRAGTNSPIGRPPTRNAFQSPTFLSPKLKHSRIALEHRLYQNPTSDWLSEVGSPPDLE